jgi:hypothetical protein
LAVSWYLTIRSDAGYLRFAATAPLIEFLAAMPELRQSGPVAFEAAMGQPWVAVILATCDSDGNYGSSDATPPQVNVVELVCSYSGNPVWYDALANRIAEYLGWSVFDEG